MKCPKCRRYIEDDSESHGACGWNVHEQPTEKLSYQRCEWKAEGKQCLYPGSMSTNLHEGGPYFCRLHFGCKDPVWGAQVVEASMDYRHETEAEKVAHATERALDNLQALGMTRGPEESFEAYRKRTVGYVKEKMSGIAKADAMKHEANLPAQQETQSA